MACTPNRFADDCDGCRHCCNPDALDGDAPTIHHTAQTDQFDRVHEGNRRRGLRGLLINNRGNN